MTVRASGYIWSELPRRRLRVYVYPEGRRRR